VQALYHLTRTLDPTRPVIGNDGWESVSTDIVGIHDYDHDPERIQRRYHGDREVPRIFRRERPGGRLLVLGTETQADVPIVLSEFGGIALNPTGTSWGYSRAQNVEDFAQRFEELIRAIHSVPLLSGFCYTQFADTYQEVNGLLTDDRRPKIPFARIGAAIRADRPTPIPSELKEEVQAHADEA
jgi:hypothetical protein